VESEQPIDHAEAFGRIAFSCPSSELKGMEEKMKNANTTILTPYVSLDTPGKATVQVVIFADPVCILHSLVTQLLLRCYLFRCK